MAGHLGAALLGVAAGVFGGMFGVGGGLVMVPGMVLLMSVPQHRAHATSVTAIVASATAAVIPLTLEGKVHWEAAALLVAGGMVGAFLGARLIARVPEVWLARTFVVIVIASAIRMALEGGTPAAGAEAAAGLSAFDVGGLVVVGMAAGSLAAMLGIGGGIVYVPALVTLFGFAQHEAQATSLAVIVPTTAVAAWVHGRAGLVDWPRAAALSAGGLIGGAAGAWSALAIDDLVLRRSFAGILVFVAYRMVMRARRIARAATPTT
ncbi:MAG: sulfite exporter TauE/SafE family protein [Actinobacteria bacterium]|nr:sulfite exporter TauE/SafE family protein [Actinomycetota bacterium]MBU1493034.1 sulfite exporter TauE/SafE family protein [Actinomycetota bacterium]MBU1866707.1 sulfite exporter TauE/SafE family protein [Actinomycetota bacterium]